MMLDSKYLDEDLIQRIGAQMMQLVQPEVKIIIDFTGVTFISSAFIGKLVLLNKSIGVAHGKWAMYGVCQGVMEPFRITSLNRVFTIVNDERAALRHVHQKSTFAW